MGIILDGSQSYAKEKIEAWFKSESSERFVLAGLAGTGKSTIIEYVIEELGIGRVNVAFCAYTGKAALVLRKKGLAATTIHSLIYDVREDDAGGIEFVLKDRLPKYIKLIVVDEASMVGKDIQKDLESYEIPIIYIGDHGQLPPVGDSFADLMTSPNVKLEQIHRQAEGNPIIWAAMQVRQGRRIPPMRNENELGSFTKIPKVFFDLNKLISAEQVLCGKNVTRAVLNRQIRERLMGALVDPSPIVSDRIMCLRNNNQTGLINGLQGTIEAIKPCDVNGRPGSIVVFKDEEGKFYGEAKRKYDGDEMVTLSLPDGTTKRALRIQAGPFLGEKVDMKDQTLAPFDYSYAITVHKSQGSQYDSVVIFEEYLGYPEIHCKWLYTAITRGIREVTLVTSK
jgi:exodeoxyribonuclease-5